MHGFGAHKHGFHALGADLFLQLGVAHRVNDRKFGDLRQVFVTDPNNVVLELNFFAA